MLLKTLTLIACAASTVYADVFISSGKYNTTTTYDLLQKELHPLSSSGSSLCFAHSKSGIADLITDSARCTQGVVIYGAVPTIYQLVKFKPPVLVLGGSRDGVSPVSQVISQYFAYFYYVFMPANCKSLEVLIEKLFPKILSCIIFKSFFFLL
jgi:hypothetical protein